MFITIVNVLSVIVSLVLIVLYLVYISCRLFGSDRSSEMDAEDARFLRTDRRPGTLDVHATANALILNYELEVSVLGEKENVLYGEKAALKKIIELPGLNSRTDCNSLAREILLHCDLIHPSRLVELEQTIYYLKKRKMTQGVASNKGTISDADSSGKSTPSDTKSLPFDDGPNINSLSDYIELLYEGVPEKIKASTLILQLAKNPDNLLSLSRNEAALSALARVLREDWRRSIVLSTNLVFTFFCFSTYTRFHPIILNYKIGSLCMDMIDFELRRYDEWKADLEGVKLPPEPSIIRRTCPSSASMTEIPKSRIPEPVRPKSSNFSDLNMKQIMEGSTYDDLSNSTDSIDKRELSEEEKAKRYRTLIKKQEQFLRVAFYLLLNLAENIQVEEKMAKKNVLGLLMKALERDNDELQVLVVTFLKKLSIVQENKDDMKQMGVVEKVAKLLQSNNADLVYITLKLLFNLSFDEEIRSKMLKVGLLPKFVSLLTDDKFQEIVMKLLYHLSYDQDAQLHFQYTDCVTLITDMLLLSAGTEADDVMVAVCINLALNKSNAQQMADNSRLHSLMSKALGNQDALVMKMIRNISEHDCTRTSFIEFVGDLAKAIVESRSEDFVLECLGVLSNLYLPDLDWAEVFRHFNMITWVQKKISSNTVEPDLILQIVVLLGTAAYDEGCAQLFCETQLISSLIELLKAHQEDDEIVLQILFVFQVALCHDKAADLIINQTDCAAYLLDLVQDNDKTIRKVCNWCLNVVADRNEEWGNRIRIEKFRHHNSQWLEMIDSQQLLQEEEEEQQKEEKFELPPYLNTEYLSSVVVPPLTEAELKQCELITESDLELDYFDNLPKQQVVQEIEAI